VGILSHLLHFKIPPASLFLGELSLDGSLKNIKGAFIASLYCREHKINNLFIPVSSAGEIYQNETTNVYALNHLRQIIEFLSGNLNLDTYQHPQQKRQRITDIKLIDNIIGQDTAKYGLLISASGGHNMLLNGPPGSGKTMLAETLPMLLPALTEQESIEVTKIYSAVGQLPHNEMMTTRPFRSPHHTISTVGLIGGGSIPHPGEISLAHRGILFLDEVPEFPRQTLETLRQPLENKNITISRSKGSITYPANFVLVGSMNPCPCGYYGDVSNKCRCSTTEILKYNKKISGPLLDRVDLQIMVAPVNKDLYKLIHTKPAHGEHDKFKDIINRTRKIEASRFKDENILTNAEMQNNHVKKYCILTNNAQKYLSKIEQNTYLSARSILKLLKLARTVADIHQVSKIRKEDIATAYQFKNFNQ
jgi:magnesium chelatase family protein